VPADAVGIADEMVVLRTHVRCVGPDERMTVKTAANQLPLDLEPPPGALCSGWQAHYCRMLTARATTSPIVTRAVSDWAAISSFARGVSGIVSVGLNAVALVNEV
jgi:hypothetical protein